ncbi:MucBP domain-containing protein [Lactiplantibacillus paraplantarum]|uniref:mucin-binding protein n=1 Tax=Lactiplantibacillus paraplantarum TaxID=60520 RepID=UPI0022214F18|nr:MucBP domain-containing protein [Lactiplantibacillus paraplantarum]MCW1909788.1 MucBP domain-containing protein [Lactiplantibacillus paraplantarum]
MLKKDNFGEPKTHYKLYKSGKNWAVMGITLVSLGLGTVTMTQAAAADSEVMNDSAPQHVTSVSTDESKNHRTSSTVVLTDDDKSDSTSINQVTSASGVNKEVSASSQENSRVQNTSQATSTSSQEASSAKSVKQTNSASNQESSSVKSAKQTNSASNQEASSAKSVNQVTSASNRKSGGTKNTSQATSTSSQKTSSVESQAQSLTATTTGKAVRATSTSVKKNSAQTKVSYSTLLQQLRTSKALASDEAALTHVDKDNFLEYFSLNGSATYDAKTGIVTITPDQNNQVGNFSLTSKIDMNKSFTLTGQVNLGSNPNGADGIGFAFHSGNTTDVGNAGGNLGIGGLQDAIGFKLDTWFNSYQAPSSNKNGSEISSTDSNGFGWNGDSANAPYGTFVKTSNQEISTANGSKVQRWWAQDTGKSQALSKADIDGHFHDFVVNYDGATRTLTVSYTQASGKVLTWTTTVASSYQAMAMIVSASTGAANNLQQFKLTSFDFQEAATVNVKYVDTTGHQLAQGTVNYPDGAYVNGRYTTKQLAIPNYRFIKMDDKSLDANGTLTHAGDNGTVIYVYAPAYMATVKTVNETINYVDESGHALTTKYTANPIHILTVTNPVDGTTTTYYSTTTTAKELDATTGKPVDSGWILSNSQDFDAVTHPQIKGYTVTSTDAPNSDLQHVAAQTVTDDSSDLEFTVVYTKNAPTVTTESKTVNETIHYVYTDGTTAHDDYVAQPITFTRTVSTDAVTGEKTYGAWSAAQQFAAVDSPAIKGYTPDQSQISTQIVTGDSGDLEFTVVYTKNAPTVTTESKTVNETIHYVYTDGTTAHDDYVAQPITFTRTVSTDAVTGEKTYGAWSAAQQFAAVDSPVIKGYTADKTSIDTQTVTGDSNDLEFTVVYTKNAPTVTTENKTVNETIHYVYTNGTTAHDDYVAQPITFTRTVSTDAVTGEKTYGAWSAAQQFAAVDSPAIKGYTPDQSQISTQTVTGDSNDLEFTVIYTKNAPTVTTESKTVNETIHYVYTDGTTAHDDYVAQPITFTRTVSTDAVTGEKTYGAWSAAQQFAAVDSPAIKGYTPDQDQISMQTVTGDSSDLEFTVVYKADSTPTKPVKPGQPTTPAKPVKPGQPTAPAKPDQPMISAKPVQTGQTTNTKFVGQRLPQTDETDQQHITLSGLLLLAMSSLLGLLGMAKRQRKE